MNQHYVQNDPATNPYVALRKLIHQVREAYIVLRKQHERTEPQVREVEQLGHNAKSVLNAVGLTYILDVHVEQSRAAYSKKSWTEDIAANCTAAQTAWSDLLIKLEKLAYAWIERNEWERARQIAECMEALQEKKRADSLRRTLERAIALSQAQAMMNARKWSEARQHAEVWFEEHPDDVEFRDILCEIYYQLTVIYMQQQAWGQVSTYLQALHKLNPTYRDTANWFVSNPWLAWVGGTIEVIQEFSGRHDGYCVAFSSDRRLMASGSGSSMKAELWETATGRSLLLNHGKEGEPDLSSVKLALIKQRLQGQGKKIKDGELVDHSVESIAFSPDGRLLASGSADKKVRLWETTIGRLVRTLEHDSRVTGIAFSLDGDLLASGGGEGTIRLWQVATGRRVCTLKGHMGGVESVVFSLDGRLLASGSWDGTVRLWEIATGRCVHTLTEHNCEVASVAFSFDGHLLASGSSNAFPSTVWQMPQENWENRTIYTHDKGAVKLWEVATGRLIHTLEGHGSWVASVAFSPIWPLLVSASGDGEIRLWEITTGQLLHTLTGHSKGVRSVAFSPDGHVLTSVSGDGTMKLWKPKV